MLSSDKKYIYFFTLFISILIFILCLILDLAKFGKNSDYQKRIQIGDCVKIENGYVKKVRNIKQENDRTNNANDEEIIKNNSTNVYTQIIEMANDKTNVEITYEEQNVQTNRLDHNENVSQLGKINIYSTNPWRIKIPKLNLDAPISEGTAKESLRRTVGHFEQTDKWKGNVALAAHNRGYRCNFFQEIKELEKGDMIIYTTEKGDRRYKVIINKIIKQTDWSYVQNTKDNRITLITCEANKSEYRRCIQAVEI